MEVTVLKEDKEMLQIEISEEGHTLCNLLRKELWNEENTELAGYNLKHPLISSPVLTVVSEKTKPKKLLQDTVDSIKKKNAELRNQLKKL